MKTKHDEYAQRLKKIQDKAWKKKLVFFNPYRIHLTTICKGNVLEIGCGIGRVLEFMPLRSIGLDHNEKAIQICKEKGLKAFSTQDFFINKKNYISNFDTILFSHILEHMTFEEANILIKEYLPFLKNNGRLILITPQEKGFKSDHTHICYLDNNQLEKLAKSNSIAKYKSYSFPFPKKFGEYFIYNENIFIGIKS